MKQNIKKHLKKIAYFASVVVVGMVLGVALQFAKAWTEPSSSAPNGNVGAPITTGSAEQTKNGILGSTRTGVPTQNIKLNGGDAGGIYIEANPAPGNSKPFYINHNGEATSANSRFDFLIAGSPKTSIREDGSYFYGNMSVGYGYLYTYDISVPNGSGNTPPGDYPRCSCDTVDDSWDCGYPSFKVVSGASAYCYDWADSEAASSRRYKRATLGSTLTADFQTGSIITGGSLQVSRGSSVNGTAAFSGSTYTSHFNYNIAEDTYIRGGKAASNVYINDVNTGNVNIATGGGRVGIGTTNTSLAKLVTQAASGERAIYGLGGVIGVEGNGSSVGIQGVGGSQGMFASGTDFDFMAAAGGGTDYGSASSIRWKKNIQPIAGALNKVMNIRGVTYDWDEEHGGKKGDLGFIAEEIGKEVPEIVSWDANAPGFANGLDYGHLTPVLVEAIKEQQNQIEYLKSQIEILKNK